MLTTTIIGNKIAEARKKMNISQAQLAEHLFISSQAVGKWERGESMPDIITFNRLAEILGVDLNYFSENIQPAQAVMIQGETPENQSAELPDRQMKKLSWDMSRGNWVEADFSGLKNLNEKFSSSNLQKCLFIGSDLSHLHLKSNNVDRCDFSDSDISRSHIQGSNLVNNQFKDCSLKETEFSGSYIMGCDFTGADFTGAAFKTGGFQNNPVNNAIWNRTSFNSMQLADMVFDGTMEDCYFENCVFTRVTFQNSRLLNTFFKNKSLKRIKFIECQADKLTYAFLKNGKADLTGIILI
jgi:uncharacterized protein YjbI with pentapeptide repeats